MEAKYYADGEDAFAMKRHLPTIEALKKEDEERAKHYKAADASSKTDTSPTIHKSL